MCMCAARMCYERLHLYQEGCWWSERALRKDDASPDHPLRVRSNIYVGLGHTLRVKTLDDHDIRRSLQSSAERHFLEAQKSDAEDHLAQYYLAFHFASTRETAKAIT